MRLLARCFNTLWFSFLLAACFQMHRAESWQHLQGLGEQSKAPVNLIENLEQTLFRKDKEFRLSEGAVNAYLQRRLQPFSSEPLQSFFTINGVAIDFEPKQATVCLRWNVLNRWTSTASLTFQLHRDDRNYLVTPTHGKLGHLTIPRGLARLLSPTLDNLVENLRPELAAIFQMQNITFHKNEVIFNPISEPAP